MSARIDSAEARAGTTGATAAPTPAATPDPAAPPMLEVRGLDVVFGSGSQAVRVLKGVDLTVGTGRTVGLVGESGSGKSTLAKALVGTVTPSAGSIRIQGVDTATLGRRDRAAMRRRVQMIPQDPYSSLDPRRTIGQALAEAVDPRHPDVRRHRATIEEWLRVVRMPADAIDRYPHEFSGGQRQRIAIARGLVVRPEFVVADEITSALDVSVQAEILNLVARLRRELGLSMLFISHNLAVVRHVSDDVVVLYRGDVVEQGPTEQVYSDPQHPYTRQLLAAVPGAPGFSID
ncbi:ABC transporter ATP-binding protein [Clavibacter michiganensis subsp. phaseoli]|jgi:ABC-type glutathione transport system ATPase component|uniref:ABC transporter ATP-binding protein n=1 Tax=Clavibacter phaseoli TaxID=1734031 RepID=A0A8I0S6W3_9MICO|nr:ABC transporter ATP-binding protein [Clavibacter phaseoli]MBF4630113.1 ABC transporter ATP-binding protein [Clavibacter phaseoli]